MAKSIKQTVIIAAAIVSMLFITSCKLGQVTDPGAKINEENEEFLKAENKGGEVFRVLLTSDEYKVMQMKNEKTIQRTPDEGGDKYMSNEIDKLNIIDEARTGLITVWLYPDSGKIMKIRSQRPTYLKEVDSLLNDDIMRWNFTFPKKVVEPTKFDISYRVVLSKKKADDEIIKAVQDRLKEGN